MYYQQVRSWIITKRIESSLSPASWKVLFGKIKHFNWIGVDSVSLYDGPVILQLIVMTTNSSTRVGISNLKSIIWNAHLKIFSGMSRICAIR